MTRARTLADMISDGVIGTTELADDAITPVKLDETGNYTIAQLDVNGTVTSDGLTVDGSVNISAFISHGGDSDTFMGFPANDAYRLDLGGNERITMDGTSTVFNDDGIDADFRVESADNTDAIFVNAGSNTVKLNVAGTVETDYATWIGSNSNNLDVGIAAQAGYLSGDGWGGIKFRDSGWASPVAWIGATAKAGNGTEKGYSNFLSMGLKKSGAADSYITPLTLRTYEGIVNDEGADYDFRIESDNNTHALFVDAGANAVHINGSTDVDDHPLVVHAGTNANAIAIRGRSDDIGEISFFENDATTKVGSLQFRNNYARLDHRASGGSVNINVGPSLAQIVDHYETGSVFNESGSNNIDFRVESDSNFACFFVDAGNGRIGINQDVPNIRLMLLAAVTATLTALL